MIQPTVPSFYSAHLVNRAGQAVLKVLTGEICEDIENVLITSLDMPSDMHAIAECELSIAKLVSLVQAKDPETKVAFNPMYLPNSTISDKIEFDSDGAITSVAGFGNPFITANFKVSADGFPSLMDTNVCFKQFELPSLADLTADKPTLLS